MPRSTQNGRSSGSARGLARSWAGAAGRRVADRALRAHQRLLALLAEAQLQLGVAGVQRRVRERRLGVRVEQGDDGGAAGDRLEVLGHVAGRVAVDEGEHRLAAQLDRPDAHALQVAGGVAVLRKHQRGQRPIGDRPVEGGDEFVVRRHRAILGDAPGATRHARLNSAAMFFGISDYASFVVAVIVFLMIPGPGNLALITSTGKGGIRGGLAATLGVIIGDQVLMWLAVAGVATLLAAYPPAFRAVQWLGAGYLAWLGLRMILAKPGDKPVLHIRAGQYFRQAFAITLLNPKAIVFYMAFFPLFVDPAHHAGVLTFAVMAATIAALTFLYGLVGHLADASPRRAAARQSEGVARCSAGWRACS